MLNLAPFVKQLLKTAAQLCRLLARIRVVDNTIIIFLRSYRTPSSRFVDKDNCAAINNVESIRSFDEALKIYSPKSSDLTQCTTINVKILVVIFAIFPKALSKTGQAVKSTHVISGSPHKAL